MSYLRRRPRCECRALFLRVTAPRQGVDRCTVAWVVRAACDRAGLPRVGAHRLRHTAATEMLQGWRVAAGDRSGASSSRAEDHRDLRQGRPRGAAGAGPPVAVAGRCVMSALRAALDDYLRIRRRLGFEMPQDGRLLEGFVEFLERAGAERITTELALAWARLPVDVHPHVAPAAHGRAGVRPISGHDRPGQRGSLHGPVARAPPADRPYIYTEAEIAALMAAARELRPALRAARHETLIGLLAVTGCAPGKRSRSTGQTSTSAGVVHVRAGKKNKQREVPLHAEHDRRAARATPVCVTPASRHPQRRRSSCPRGDDGWDARSSTRRSLKLVRQVGLEGRGARARPRPHDLRHAFAVHTLLDWHRAGEDIDRRMPLLSTYLGHVDPASTYWYLEAVPELLELVGRRLEQLPGGARHDRARARAAGVLHRAADHPAQRSPQTIAAYRDTFRLLLRFAHEQTGKQPFELDIDDLDAPLIGAFLTHLEQRPRQQPPHPQRPARRDPLVLPVRRARTSRARAHDRAGHGDPDQTPRAQHRLLPRSRPRSRRCSPRPTAAPGSAAATAPCWR